MFGVARQKYTSRKTSAMLLVLSKRFFLPKQPQLIRIFAASVIGLFLLTNCTHAGQAEGFTEPYHDLAIAATGEPGLITEINVREGQKVKKGQVLAVIDTRVLEKSLAIAKRKASVTGRAVAMRAELKIRATRMEKMQAMFSKGHISSVEMERAKTDYEVAEANLLVTGEDRELAAMEVARIEAQIERQKVRSPIAGVVVTLHREMGESIMVTDPKLMRLVSLDMLRVKFPMTVAQTLSMQEGQYLEVSLPEIQGTATAVVEVVSPVLDAKSGTVQVTCLIDNSEGKYRSGMRCLFDVDDEDSQTETESDIQFEYPTISVGS